MLCLVSEGLFEMLKGLDFDTAQADQEVEDDPYSALLGDIRWRGSHGSGLQRSMWKVGRVSDPFSIPFGLC